MMPRPVSPSPTSDSSGASVPSELLELAALLRLDALEGEAEPARAVVAHDGRLDHQRSAGGSAVEAEREPLSHDEPRLARDPDPLGGQVVAEHDLRRVAVEGGQRGDAAAVRAALGAAPLAARLRLRRLRGIRLARRLARRLRQHRHERARMVAAQDRLELGVGFRRERVEIDRHAPALAAARAGLALRARDVTRERVERRAAQLRRQLERDPVARFDQLVDPHARRRRRELDQLPDQSRAADPQVDLAAQRQPLARAPLAAVVQQHRDQQPQRLLVDRAVHQIVYAEVAELAAQLAEVLAVNAQPDRRDCDVLARPAGAELERAPHGGDQELARRRDRGGRGRPATEREFGAEPLQDHPHAVQLAVVEHYHRGGLFHAVVFRRTA